MYVSFCVKPRLKSHPGLTDDPQITSFGSIILIQRPMHSSSYSQLSFIMMTGVCALLNRLLATNHCAIIVIDFCCLKEDLTAYVRVCGLVSNGLTV